jgi:hypothetical protein
VGKKKYINIIEMDNDFEEGNCEEMPDLNITGSAVQPYMFEPTKGTSFASDPLFLTRKKNCKIIGNLPMTNMFSFFVLVKFVCIRSM